MKMSRKQHERISEWDPPAPSTVYIKIKNIPYETFKTRLNQGLVTTDLDQIRYRLEKHIYCCEVCSKYVNGYCVITNRKADSGWICKSFVPKEEYIYLDAKLHPEGSDGFRYLSETRLGKENFKDQVQERQSSEIMELEDLYREGVALYRQGRLRFAIETLDKVLSKNPQHFASLFYKGNALLKLKCYEEALKTFEKAAEINSSNAALWANLGTTFFRLERFSSALEAFDRSISLNPVQKNAWEGKDAVTARIRLAEENLKESEKLLETDPSNADLLFEKGKLHLKLGSLEQARKAFEEALKEKPENAEAWQLRGKVLFEMGYEKEALHAFEKAIRNRPDFPEAWYEKGQVFLKLSNLKSAENAFKIAADLWKSKGLETRADTALQKIRKIRPGKN